MATLKYTDQHEWLSIDGDVARVGITNYAQGQLGDVVFVELPESGADFNQGDEAAVVESVKAASDIYAPVSGTVSAINEQLEEAPEIVNDSPYDDGWFFKITPLDLGEVSSLLTSAEYRKVCEEGDH